MATTEKLPVQAGAEPISFAVNGRAVELAVPGTRRLSRVLRDDLGLTGTKVGCDAGDCGACTVLLDGEPVCACLVAAGQVAGCEMTTVEGLAQRARLCQDGCRNPFSLTARRSAAPARPECWSRRPRCSRGIRLPAKPKSWMQSAECSAAVPDIARSSARSWTRVQRASADVCQPAAGAAVGARLVRLDGQKKVDGTRNLRSR